MLNRCCLPVAALVLAAAAGQSVGGPITFSGTDLEVPDAHSNFRATTSATFHIDAGNLVLTLTYESFSGANLTNGAVLAGLTWEVASAGSGDITAVSAILADGSSYVNGTGPDNGNVSTAWAYRDNISMTGFGSFGVGAVGGEQPSVFGASDLIQDPPPYLGPLNGVDWGLVGVASDSSEVTVNSNQGPQIQNSLVFTFELASSVTDFDPESHISGVSFLFGSDIDLVPGEPLPPPPPEFQDPPIIPEPTSLALFGLGLLGMAGYGVRRRKTAV